MADYIDRDALIRHLKDEIEGCGPPYSVNNGRSIAYGTELGLKMAISYASTLPAVDVVEKIFEEIEKILTVDESRFGILAECGLEEGFSYCETYVHNLRNKLAELKKKYESEGAE